MFCYVPKQVIRTVAIGVATSALLSVCVAQSSNARPGAAETSPKRGSALAECREQYRLAEIGAQVPHSSNTMDELCLNVELHCEPPQENSPDCVHARKEIPGLIRASGLKGESPLRGKTK